MIGPIPAFDALENAMNAAGLPVQTSYCEDLTGDITSGAILADGKCLVIQPLPFKYDDEITSSTGANVLRMTADLLAVSDVGAKDAVQTLHDWFTDIGWVTENGILGTPAGAPWLLGTIKIYEWEPEGGLPTTALKFGKYWAAAVRVNLLINVT